MANANAKSSKSAEPKALNKTTLKAKLAEETGLSAKEVGIVLDSLSKTITEELNRKGVNKFTLPGVIKITKVEKPATPEKQMISPFTKQMTTVKAKPARNVVRVRPLKGLKDSIA